MKAGTKKLLLDEIVAAWGRAPATRQKPKYVQLADVIQEVIDEGEYEVGDHLPSEIDISNAMPVGLSTVQSAMSQLVEKGIVTRRRRLGTLIADPKRQAPEVHLYRFRDPVTNEVALPFTRALGVERIQTAEFGALLASFDNEQAIRLDRLVWVAGSSPGFSSVFMRLEHAQGLLDAPLETLHGLSCHRLLQEESRTRIAATRHGARADLLSARACAVLDLAAPHVGLVWEAHDLDAANNVVLAQRLELPQGHSPMELTELK